MFMRTSIAVILVIVVMTKNNLTVTTKCTLCVTNTTQECFYLHGGPFNHFEISVEDTIFASCGNSSNDLSFPDTATFSCGSDQSCTDNNCFLYQSDWEAYGQCTGQYYASKTMDNLNYFYRLSIGDHTEKYDYPWCDNLCGTDDSLPMWAIIVIAALGALVVAGAIAVGIYCWRRRSGRIPVATTDAGAAERLIR